MVEHTPAIRRLLRTNCLSVFDHFMRLTLKELTMQFKFCICPSGLHHVKPGQVQG